jgi:Protein of unknown function (DUF3131)
MSQLAIPIIMFLNSCLNQFKLFIRPFRFGLVGLLSTLILIGNSTAIAKPTPIVMNHQATCPASNFAALTPAEQQYAKVAWQYFRDNMQPQTGLVNAVEQYPSTSLWDTGNALMALHSARSLNLIDTADFDHRLNQLLKTLSELPLVDRQLPNKAYDTTTAKMVNYQNQPSRRGIGWSALDIGRLLTALYVVQDCYPGYHDWIQTTINRWDLNSAIDQGQLIGASITGSRKQLLQEGRLGYEEYAALGFKLWGFPAPKALDRRAFRKFTEIYGIQIPVDQRDYAKTNASNYVVSESYILQGLEFGGDAEFLATSAQILAVQQRRYEQTGILTAVSEDHVKGKPHFLYNTIYANGIPWANITENNQAYPKLRSLSTKAAFGWHYLYPDQPYAQRLFDTAVKLQHPDAKGFYAGQFESNQMPNVVLTGNTNGLILESLLYKAQGYQPFVRSGKLTDRVSLTPPAQRISSVVNRPTTPIVVKPPTVVNSTVIPTTTTTTIPTATTTTIPTTVQSGKSLPVLLGTYTQSYLGDPAVVDREFNGLSDWSGKRLSLAGMFFDLEDDNPGYNIPKQLELLHKNGLTTFLNLSARRPAVKIANGELDASIKRIAQAYANWAKQGSDRVAFIAPFPEMNGSWEIYGQDPTNFKLAYQRIQQIFAAAGVPKASVRWVFAPNGWTATTQHQFENYYPGANAVDAVAFSGYNWGYCQRASWPQWDRPEVVFGPYLQRLRGMAPGKPIVIAQTATTSATQQGNSVEQKDEWLRTSYRYLAEAPNVQGILYFNLQKECDWPIYTANGAKSQGFKDGVAHAAFRYVAPGSLNQAGF